MLSEIQFDAAGRMAFRELTVGWELLTQPEDGEFFAIRPEDMEHFEAEIHAGEVIGFWQGHSLLGPGFTVKCRWRAEAGALLGRIGYSGGAGRRKIEFIRFPVVELFFPANGTLLLPEMYGMILHRPLAHVASEAEPALIFRSEMVPMRASAMLLPQESFLFDFRDPGWLQKDCEYFRGSEGKLRFAGKYLVPLDDQAAVAHELPYECGITPFPGGWYEAARLYRQWAVTQRWAAGKILHPRLREIGCWCWNRGLIENVVPPVEQLKKDAGCDVALSWYWWHHNPYDTDYPDYWPPREGAAAFAAAIRRLAAEQIHVQVYVNGMTWDMDGSSTWPGGEEAIVLRRDGSPEAIAYNTFNHHRLGSICGASEEFQRRLLVEIDHLAEAGLPGVYIDMIGNANHRACYHAGHGHAPGGGDYHYQGYRRLIEKLRARYPDLILSTEDCGEDFMDLMDCFIGFHISSERFNFDPDLEMVPLYPAIYHGIMPLYGSYTLPDGIPPYDPAWPPEGKWQQEKDWLKLFPDQVFLELARQLVYGNMLTVANLQLKHCVEEKYREVYDYLCALIRFYMRHREFLFDGDMLPPPVIECDSQEVDFMARFIYTHESEMKTPRYRRQVVFGSRWRSPAGDQALVLVNWSGQAARYECHGRDGVIPARTAVLIPEE